MKNLSREQRYEMKMNFFSEVSVRELASKLLVAIIAICVIINGADQITNSINNALIGAIVATSIIIIFGVFVSLLFIKELNILKKIEKKS
ncbi:MULTISPECIES: hypothetical protein [Staphylococcus]|uniref:hypothetical protein n=1 Tax=Staphylococcus TaxID=1279 RepID=UPI000CD1492C|nr:MULTISPECIES: hypothetical protein [Staphylococcus]MBX5320309.1 hypothetical protein [Staphylococcus caprae]MCR6087303.1 hypothetical protein [Staphylococcus aureus]POA02499.1 hypothetical protein CD155_11050 [Staphylococcus caprae]SUL89595.1 Uncharacterised protein [Staphylococcus caprae]